jgi:very-short-patch-repair endonuclease
MEFMKKESGQRGEMLLAIFKYTYSLTILQDEGWYHIPVNHAPKTWPPKWLCFYQGKIFGKEAYRVERYGELESYEIVPYHELFPNKIESEKSNWLYYRVRLKELKRWPRIIPSFRPRRLTFIPTTWAKFESAEQINDLFDESPLEDIMWKELKKLDVKAERQWELPIEKRRYYLDFAIFCNNGFIDVETDGDTWHARKDRIPLDNDRNNELAQKGWQVLRYNGKRLREMMGKCIREVRETINSLRGLSDDGLVPRVFYQQGNQSIQQLSMFEPKASYSLYSGAAENLEV